MSVSMYKIKGRDNKPVPYKKKPYPQFTAVDLPRNYWVGLFVGMRGSGKTVQAIKLMKMMEESPLKDAKGNNVAIRHILFSPTVGSNENFHALKYLADEDIHNIYTDEKLEEVLNETKTIRKEAEEYQVLKKIFDKYEKNPDKQLSINEEAILDLYDYERPEPPKYPNGVVTNIIYDDLIGTETFSTKRGSPVMSSVYNGRHIDINILIIAQDIMKIPNSIRMNSALLVVFRYCQKKVIENIYNEISGLMTFDKFVELYDTITKEDHCFLCVDGTQKKENRVKKNFEFIVKY